ncbi:MAG: hypothetical protein Q9170_002392 [Blastenia crenularia]
MSALLHHAVAAPGVAELDKRVIATSYCFQDNLYRSFIDPKTSASASSFCSTYLRTTVTTATTTTATVTAVAAKRGLEEKRALAATTQFPASRLSSACSCILTAKPSMTTVYSTTATVFITTTSTSSSITTSTPTTSTSSSTSSESTTSSSTSTTSSTSSTITTSSTTDSSSSTSTTSSTTTSAACGATPIVKNGDFETGALAPWTIASVYPGREDSQYYNYGVTKNGDSSVYAFTVTDNAASSYFNLQLAQTLSVCPGQTYNFAARYFMTDAHDGPQTFVTISVDGKQIAASKITDAHTPPRYVSLSGSFTTGAGGEASLVIGFVATDYLGVQWGIDNMVVTPA